MNRDTTLVIGGRGKTGRRVVERLQALAVPVRVGSREGRPPFDWNDRETWPAALEGVGAAYVTYHPDLAVPGAAATVGAFAREAVARGATRLVLLSGRGEEEAERAERALAEAGAEWTVVRSSFFSQNFSESFFRDPLLAGELALPVDGVPEPFVDADDVADVAVAALTQEGHAGKLYEVTGPRLLEFAEAVEEIARAAGRPMRFVPVTAEEFQAAMLAEGLPADLVWLLRYLFAEVLDGRNAHLADGVRRALGREPRDFRAFAREAAAGGAWSGRQAA